MWPAPPAALHALPGPERWAAAMRRAAATPLPPTTNSVTTAVTGAIQPLIDAIGTLDDNKDDEVNKDDEKEKVDEAVEKALQPLKEQVESIVKALGGNTTNLNNNQSVKKSSQHYMAGMF